MDKIGNNVKTDRDQAMFYDMHAHILPQVDDGARSMEETQKMLEFAYSEGIRCICATPHMDIRRAQQPEVLLQIQSAYEAVCRKMREWTPDMRLYLGCEMMYFPGMAQFLKEAPAALLGDSKYVLVEFLPSAGYRQVLQGVQELIQECYIPVIAHVERLDCLWKRQDRLEELKNIYVYLQLNTQSISGSWFDASVRWCRKLVKNGYIDLLGTDMHDLRERMPVYRAAARWIAEHCGQERLDQLSIHNPQKILNNQNTKGVLYGTAVGK